VFTIHNIEYQGRFPKDSAEDLFGIPASEYGSISDGEAVNLMKAAIDYADAVSTVSPTYAKEIQSDYFAHGLAVTLSKNKHKLTGILNGIDTVGYDAKTDKALFENFDADTLETKTKNKTELQKMLNLTVSVQTPMIAVISRLVAHKGIDLLKAASNELLGRDVQLVVLGTGNAEYEAFFKHLAAEYPKKVCAIIAYNKDLSRKIYGAADMFLMPSKSEPCGLSQMIASRYATVPLVRETGGLYDSIKDCNDGHSGNGYTFSTYNAGDMLNCINRALGLYNYYPTIWKELQRRILSTDFSWGASAKEYIKMYDGLFKQA
jgi:starch synthase